MAEVRINRELLSKVHADLSALHEQTRNVCCGFVICHTGKRLERVRRLLERSQGTVEVT